MEIRCLSPLMSRRIMTPVNYFLSSICRSQTKINWTLHAYPRNCSKYSRSHIKTVTSTNEYVVNMKPGMGIRHNGAQGGLNGRRQSGSEDCRELRQKFGINLKPAFRKFGSAWSGGVVFLVPEGRMKFFIWRRIRGKPSSSTTQVSQLWRMPYTSKIRNRKTY